MSNAPPLVEMSCIVLVNSWPFGTPTISSVMPVSFSQRSLMDGAPAGKGLVNCPIDPSERPRTILVGALPAPFISFTASMARPSGCRVHIDSARHRRTRWGHRSCQVQGHRLHRHDLDE